MPLGDWTLSPNDISWFGADLSRPECVLASRDGTVWCSDNRGGVLRIAPDGSRKILGSLKGAPNGFALERGGSVVIADIDDGNVYRLHPDGRQDVVLSSFGSKPLKAPNFVLRDGERLWITISTLHEPRRQAAERGIVDGFVLVIENGTPRLAAKGFAFTNEIRIDRTKTHLYVAETGKGRVVRLPLAADGTCGTAQPFGPDPLFPGARIDGLAFDAEGNLWATEILRNGLYVIAPDGACRKVFEDPDAKVMRFPASLCFCGPDLRTVLIGTTMMPRLLSFRAPVPGEPLAHWQD